MTFARCDGRGTLPRAVSTVVAIALVALLVIALVAVRLWRKPTAAPETDVAIESPSGGPIDGVVPLWSCASGAVFAVTVMLNVATLESLTPSFAFQVKLSGPV